MTRPTPYPIPSELCRLLALRRVRRGHVVLGAHDLVVDHGRPVPDYIRTTLRELLDDGYLHLGAERAGWGQWPVLVAPSGEQLHTKLEETSPVSVLVTGRRNAALPAAAAGDILVPDERRRRCFWAGRGIGAVARVDPRHGG